MNPITLLIPKQRVLGLMYKHNKIVLNCPFQEINTLFTDKVLLKKDIKYTMAPAALVITHNDLPVILMFKELHITVRGKLTEAQLMVLGKKVNEAVDEATVMPTLLKLKVYGVKEGSEIIFIK